MKEVYHRPRLRLHQWATNIPLVGKCFILILFGYAINEFVYPFFSNEGAYYTYPSGNKYWLTEQNRVKGWTDLILQICKNVAMCLLIKEYAVKAAWFFYILFWYSVVNLGFYWYDHCQIKLPFYLMYACLCYAAYRLWPTGGKVVKM